jgi:hypothetical protein
VSTLLCHGRTNSLWYSAPKGIRWSAETVFDLLIRRWARLPRFQGLEFWRPWWVLGRTGTPTSPVGIQWFGTIWFGTIWFRKRWRVRRPRSTRFEFEVGDFGESVVGLSGRTTSCRVGIAHRVALAHFECRLRRQWQQRFRLQPCGRQAGCLEGTR